MAAFTSNGWFVKGLVHVMKGDIHFDTDTIVCIPVSAVPDQTAHEFISDLTEINSPSSRVTLTSKVISEDATNKEVELDCTDPEMPSLPTSNTYIGYVIAKSTGTDATSPCLFFVDTDNVTCNGGNIKVTLPAEGICKIQA